MAKKEKKKKKPVATKKPDRGTSVCSQLVEWRKKSGLSQSKTAAFLQVNLRTYQNWEQLKRKPRGLSLVTLEGFIKSAQQRSAAA